MMDIPDIHLKVVYDFEYETKDKRKIHIIRGEKLFLLNKTNSDWWQVIRNSSERPFYVPASYVTEISEYKTLPNDGKRHSCTERTVLYPPVNSDNIPRRSLTPDAVLRKEVHSFNWMILDGVPSNGSDCDAKLSIPHSVSDGDNVVSSVSCYKGYEDKKQSILCDEAFKLKSEKSDFCHGSEILEHDVEPCLVKRSKTPELVSENLNSSRGERVQLEVDSVTRSEEIKNLDVTHSAFDAEKEKLKTSSSWEKLLQKFKFRSIDKHKEIAFSQCDPVARDVGEVSWSFHGDRETSTYPRGAHAEGKNKLSYSKSFQTRREVKNISTRQHRKTHLSSSWEGKEISDFSVIRNSDQLHSEENAVDIHKSSPCSGNERKIGSLHVDKTGSVELISNKDSELTFVENTTTLVPVAFQNSLCMLSHPNNVSIQNRESTESLDGFLDEDGVSDSEASFRSSELLNVHDTENYSPRNPIHEDVTYSSCDDVDYCVLVPSGWKKSYDEVSGEQCYINENSRAKTVVWFVATSSIQQYAWW